MNRDIRAILSGVVVLAMVAATIAAAVDGDAEQTLLAVIGVGVFRLVYLLEQRP
jgi:hypothetical protein